VAGNPQIVVEYVAKTADFAKGLKGAEQQAESTSGRLKSMGKVALAAAGAAGLGALVATFKVGIDEFSEAAKVGAQTEAVIKSTGKAAGVSAKQVESLATQLMNKSGMDDEAIQSGENLLLTFTRIQNVAGKGNDIFNQTTKTMVDMSVALGQDAKTSALQLGKALNDPIKGVTALQRVGVSFTKAQKEQIKTLEESGHHIEAQKLILHELNKEFGGSAEAAGKTLPGQMKILRENFNNLAGSIVGALVPALSMVASFFTKHPDLAKAVTIGVLALAAAMVALNVAMAVTAALSAGILGPFAAIAAALAAIVVVAILVVKNWDKISEAMTTAMNTVKRVALATLNWLRANWPLIVGILTGPIGAAVVLIVRHWDKISGAARDAFNAVKSLVTSFTSWLAGMAGKVGDAVAKVADALGKIDDPFVAAIGAIKSAISSLPGFITGLVGKIRSAASAVADALKAPINAVLKAWNGLEFHIPKISLPSVKILGKKIGGGSFGGQTFGFPNIPLLAKGAVISSPTLAMVGEGGGREIVTPEALLRAIVSESGGGSYTLNLYPRQVNAADVAWGFRRLELLRAAR
jgi:phage-related protein